MWPFLKNQLEFFIFCCTWEFSGHSIHRDFSNAFLSWAIWSSFVCDPSEHLLAEFYQQIPSYCWTSWTSTIQQEISISYEHFRRVHTCWVVPQWSVTEHVFSMHELLNLIFSTSKNKEKDHCWRASACKELLVSDLNFSIYHKKWKKVGALSHMPPRFRPTCIILKF